MAFIFISGLAMLLCLRMYLEGTVSFFLLLLHYSWPYVTVALLFNWIGLFAALCCLTVTIAGRAGAISGFGLSVVKWAFLVMVRPMHCVAVHVKVMLIYIV